MRTNYQEIKLRGRKRWKCERGYWHVLIKTISQTVNPWNLNKAGLAKSNQEIMAELWDELRAWYAVRGMCATDHKRKKKNG